LVDNNTHHYCLPYFLSHLDTELPLEIIEIEAGEINKTINTCYRVWETLSELNADRKSVLLNLGGGVITDLGGFVASCFKRGIDFINIPTTLLAMVDASVGGKNGVDLGALKNQIGVISPAKQVLIDTTYLQSLPKEEMRSGLAEMLKHGLIQDATYWNTLCNLSQHTLGDLDQLIYESVVIKNRIVLSDPTEKGLRKTLNFGHTLGHAIESYFLEQPNKANLLHGEAVAVGMILAVYISSEQTGLCLTKRNEISTAIRKVFAKIEIETVDYKPIMDLLKYDKKNSHGKVNFVLLEAIGTAIIDCEVPDELIKASFEYYQNYSL
jgi:3-dehydroquinate synthase